MPKNSALTRSGGLRPREKKFIAAYFETFNPQLAAIAAGYKEDNAAKSGKKLLASLSKEISEYGDDLLTKSFLRAPRILQETALLAFHNPKDAFDEERGHLLPFHQMGELARCIQSYEEKELLTGEIVKKIKFYSKQDALEMLAKVAGMFTDGPQVSIPVTFQFGEPLPPPIKQVNPHE